MNPSQLTPEQQAQLYQRQLAQQNQMAQNPQMAAQMRQQQAYMQQHQQRMMAQGGFQQNQHLQPQFQQRRPSPMGQMPQGQMQMNHPGQQNPMVGFQGMPPPSSGPMGVTMQPGMHPQQQQAYQQQMMRNNNAQFPVGMNPQMASVSPHPQGTPSRPPSQMQGAPMNMPGGATPSNMPQGNMTPVPQQPAPQNAQNTNQMTPQQRSPMGPPSQNGSVSEDKSAARVDTLLDINNILLKLALDLQAQGKSHTTGGQQSPTTGGPNENGAQSPSQPNANPPKLTQLMVFITRPLQANIGYLTGSAQGKRPKWPFIMELPAAWPPGSSISEDSLKQLQDLYAKLRSLFPEYQPGLDAMTGQPKPAQGQMRPPQQQVQHQQRQSMDNQGSPLAAAPS